MKIPKSFKLFSSTVNVSYDDNQLSFNGNLGECQISQNTITLCNKYKGQDLPEDTIVDTFWHEKVHHILDAMGEHDMSNNEKFVEIFSKLLRQADETAEY